MRILRIFLPFNGATRCRSIIIVLLQFLNVKLSGDSSLPCEEVLQLYLQFAFLSYQNYLFYHYFILILFISKAIYNQFRQKPWLIFESACMSGKNFYPAGIYLLKVNKSTRTRCEIYSKLTVRTPERWASFKFQGGATLHVCYVC